MMKLFDSRSKWAALVIFVSAVCFILYSCIRAATLSITWDEAFTYLEFVKKGMVVPHTFVKMSANNHLLNTALMIVSTRLFGIGEFALRLPNILAHLLFLYYSAKLVWHFENKWVSVFSFILLNCNPYFIEFFSLARGYGLSFAFLMAAFYHYYTNCIDVKEMRRILYATAFCSLALLANFALLNLYLAFIGVMLLDVYLRPQKATKVWFLKQQALSLLIVLTTLLVVLSVTFKLNAAGALFFGDNNSFRASTISPLISQLLMFSEEQLALERIVKLFILISLLWVFITIFRATIRRKMDSQHYFITFVFVLLILACTASVLQHQLFHTPYLLNRTALFLYLLWTILFVLFMDLMSRKSVVFVIASGILCGLMILHFSIKSNNTRLYEWRYDADTKNMISDLIQIHQNETKQNISLGTPLIVDPDIEYYQEKYNINWLQPGWTGSALNTVKDYYFVPRKWLTPELSRNYKILKEYTNTNSLLIQPVHY